MSDNNLVTRMRAALTHSATPENVYIETLMWEAVHELERLYANENDVMNVVEWDME